MKKIKSKYFYFFILCVTSSCVSTSLQKSHYPDFWIDIEPSLFYPYSDTTTDYINRIAKSGDYLYLHNDEQGTNWKYLIEKIDTVANSFVIGSDYRRKRKGKGKNRTIPEHWAYSSLVPTYNQSKLLLDFNFFAYDSVVCKVIHLPDTINYSVKTTGRIWYGKSGTDPQD